MTESPTSAQDAAGQRQRVATGRHRAARRKPSYARCTDGDGDALSSPSMAPGDSPERITQNRRSSPPGTQPTG